MVSVAREPAPVRLRRDVGPSDRRIARVIRTLAAWRHRARGRTQLAHLSERELRDIGLTAAEAARECAKPFWRG